MKYFLVLIAFLGFSFNFASAQSLDYDLGISGQEIYFSKNNLVVGDSIRLYARIRNLGKNDLSGYVRFYQGTSYIGDSQAVSVIAGSVPDEVYLDWIVPSSAFNIRAEIKGQVPSDENPSNDVAITSLFTPKFDTDHDGIFDDVDPDDDNDGLLDGEEIELGTNPKVADTDGDGVNDGNDFYPLDPTRWEEPKKILPKVETTSTNTTTTTTNTSTNTNTNSPLPSNDNINTEVTSDSVTTETLSPELINEPENTEAVNTSTGSLVNAQLLINTKRINWQTYQFFADPRTDTTQQLEFNWNFGDGATSTRPYPTHTYNAPGDYTVQVSVYDKIKGTTLTSEQTMIKISFFNIGNYQLWLLLLGIVAVLGIILKIVHLITKPRE